MKKIVKILLICLGCFIGVITIIFAGLMLFGKGNVLLPVAKKDVFAVDINTKYAQSLFVQDNKIMNASGEQIRLKGIMVPEAQKLNIDNDFNEEYFKGVFESGANVIRIPVHPKAWVSDEYYLWRYLDPIVTWAIKYNKYVIIDLHFIGNIETGAGSEMVDVKMKPYDFSVEFWNTVASYFKDVPNVIFEIYNEPASISGDIWSVHANSLVETIRNTGSNQLILVSGIDYSYDLSYWERQPLEDENIAYSAHIFPNRIGWKRKFETMANTLPIVVTEWGYASEDGLVEQAYLKGNRKSYGEPIIQFMEEHNIGWVACWYDDGWEPPMFYEGMEEMTDWGMFVMKQLSQEQYGSKSCN